MTIGGISFPVIEELIAKVIGLPVDRERAFRIHSLAGIHVCIFLKYEFKEMNWRSGV